MDGSIAGMAGKPRKHRASVKDVYVGLRLTGDEVRRLDSIVAHERTRRPRPTGEVTRASVLRAMIESRYELLSQASVWPIDHPTNDELEEIRRAQGDDGVTKFLLRRARRLIKENDG